MDVLNYVMEILATAWMQGMRQPPPENRALATAFTVFLGCIALWGVGMAAAAVIRQPRYFTGRAGLRLVNWIGIAVSAAGVALLGIAVHLGDGGAERIIEIVLPFAVGVQAAMLFSPEDEPGLEVLLSCPRPITWLMLERLGLLAAAHLLIGLVGMAISYILLPQQTALLMLARWLPSTVMLTGMGLFATVRSRSLIFGVLLTGLVSGGLLVFSPLLLPGMLELPEPLNHLHAYLWSVNPFLQPSDLGLSHYWLNRLCVIAIGGALITWTAWSLRDEERVLMGSRGWMRWNRSKSTLKRESAPQIVGDITPTRM